MTRAEQITELRQLISAAISATASDDEMRTLDSALRNDDAALDLFLHYCQLEVDLKTHAKANSNRWSEQYAA
jgi:hypothetical protein